MKLQSLISSIRQPQNTEKTASESTPAPVATETKLAGALREAAAAATAVTKVASEEASSPVADVMKVAAEIAGAEQEAAVKEAALLGAAFADAALSRFATWEKAAAQLPAAPQQTKVASVAQQADETFAKYAEENPVLARQAIALGYAPTAGGLEKMAEDSYVQGYNDQVSEIHKTAQDEFLKAAAMTSLIIEQAQGK